MNGDLKQTRTFTVLIVSTEAYTEIRDKLREAGYDHAFLPTVEQGTLIDMHGIAIGTDYEEYPETKVTIVPTRETKEG